MPGFLDITRRSKKVDLGEGGSVEVFGLSPRDMRDLVKRFPELEPLLDGDWGDLKPGAIVDMVPEAMEAIVAIAVIRNATPGGWADDRARMDAEAKAADIAGLDFALLLAAIAECSLPARLSGPFVEMLTGVPPPLSLAAADPGRAPDTGLPQT